ncbi:MAG: T9SS type A sorting domain-containing protein [Bacteroidetes bacterium]|nr:T9SS type A sorting domain-containing protein [Bacteroidota bacterium]
MKKIILISTLLVQTILYGQAIPNGTFETWNSTPYNEPDGWYSGNMESIRKMGVVCVTKVAGFGTSGFAVRMETKVVGSDTSHAYISNSQGDPLSGKGGAPYSQKPANITGYYRYNLPVKDTALFFVIFKKNGSIVSNDLFKIRGTGSQSTFASFSFPLTLAVTPDSVIIAAAASNLMSNVGVQNGSFLELDKLVFTGTGITQQVSNNEFENWTTKNYDIPGGWEVWGDGVTKTTDKYAGSYAIRLETTSDHGANSSGITTGQMTQKSGPAGGRPYTMMKDTLCGYYKYTSMGSDTANVYISLTNKGTNVGGGAKWLIAATNYIYFEVPFQAGVAPDTIRIDFQSSHWPTQSVNSGSVLFVDNLWLKSSPLGIFENEKRSLESYSYPNPAKDILSVRFEKSIYNSITLVMYDAIGREVNMGDITINTNSLQVNIADLPSGMYFYIIRTSEESLGNKFIKQ